jgi:hypothetical protein
MIIHDLILNDQVKEDKTGRACSTLWEVKAYRILVGKPERKRLPGRHRHRWEDNIKIEK